MLPFRSKKYRISYKNVMNINNKKVIVLCREKSDTNLFVNVPLHYHKTSNSFIALKVFDNEVKACFELNIKTTF